MHMETITQPVLVVDEKRCRKNMADMLARACHAGVVLRPHFKTHQSELVGEWFREAGVDRIAVSSVSMAEQFAAAGWHDILIAFPLNFRERYKLNVLACKVNLGVLLSCQEAIALTPGFFSSPVTVYLKVDVGSRRTGFDPGDAEALLGAFRMISTDPLLRPGGLLAHAGHTYQACSRQEVKQVMREGLLMLTELLAKLSAEFPGLKISWGDTPSCSLSKRFPGAHEIRPGNFVFYDLMQLALGACSRDQLALSVAAPVVAIHPGRREAVLYAGAVHLSKEQGACPEGRPHYGQVVYYKSDGHISWPRNPAYVRRISQEHGIAEFPEGIPSHVKPGILLGVIPVHACLAADLIKKWYVV
jgi:D-serine deaminase-like pyridoxal phosphate-dependent protein